MKKFLSIVLMILLVVSPVMVVDAKTTTTKSTKTTVTTKKTTTKKTTTKKTTTKKTTTKEAKEDKSPINIYIFYRNSCPRCAELHSFLDKLKEDKTYGKMFNVIDYEVTSNSENIDLMDEVANYFKEENDGSVPVYVIGDQYLNGFLESQYADTVKEAIKKAYDNQVEDKVAKVIESLKNKKDNNILGYVVLAIVAVIIVGVIYSSSKNKYYDEDDSEAKTVDEPKEEPVNEEVKKETKKTNTKKASTTTKKKTTKKQSK